MTSSPDKLRSIVDSLMQEPMFKKRWITYQIASRWVELVGKRIAQHIRPLGLSDDLLMVAADDERWAKGFDELQANVIAKMDKALGPGIVKGFSIRMERGGNMQRQEKEKHIEEKGKKDTAGPKRPKNERNKKLDKDMEQGLSKIKDREIRESMRRLIIRSMIH